MERLIRATLALWTTLLVCGSAHALGDRAENALESALADGAVDPVEARVLRVIAAAAPEQLPLWLRDAALDDADDAAAAGTHRCGTPALADLLRGLDQLSEAQRSRVEAALAMPLPDVAALPWTDDDGDPPRATSESCTATAPNEQSSDHFVVKWGNAYSGGGVDDLLTAMEAARETFLGIGYREPYGVENDGWKLPIYIGNSGGGVPTIGWSGGYTTLCGDYPGAYIVLSPDIESWSFTADVGPHELFHAVQFGYPGAATVPMWWYEATAVWSEDLTYPDINGYTWFLGEYVNAPHLRLDDESGVHPYGMFIFPTAVDQFVDGGRDALREVWEQAGPPTIPEALGATLEGNHGTTFADAFAEFTARASVMEDFVDGALYNPPTRVDTVGSYPDDGPETANNPPQWWGSNYVEFRPDDSEEPYTKLVVEFDGGGSSEWVLGALRHRAGDGSNKTVYGEVDGEGKATLEFIDFGTLYDGVVIGVTWTGQGASPPYSWTADVVEQTEPQGDDDDDDSADPDLSALGCLATPSPYQFSPDAVDGAASCDATSAPLPPGATAAVLGWLSLVGLLGMRRRPRR